MYLDALLADRLLTPARAAGGRIMASSHGRLLRLRESGWIFAVEDNCQRSGGLEPMLGSAHLRVPTIVGFPTATTPGILDDLKRLAFAYRWSTRAVMLDKRDATKLLTRLRRQWFAERKWVPRS